jgi:hypothetical protein
MVCLSIYFFILYSSIFTRFPESKALFKRVGVDEPNSGAFRSHLVRVANGLDTIINLLDDPDVLAQQLEHLSAQHIARDGVKKAYFGVSYISFNSCTVVFLLLLARNEFPDLLL